MSARLSDGSYPSGLSADLLADSYPVFSLPSSASPAAGSKLREDVAGSVSARLSKKKLGATSLSKLCGNGDVGRWR